MRADLVLALLGGAVAVVLAPEVWRRPSAELASKRLDEVARVDRSVDAMASGSVAPGPATTPVARLVTVAGASTVRQRVGGLGLLALASVIGPLPIVVGLAAWWGTTVRARSHRERRRAVALVDELPDVVDLLRMAVGAGLTLHLAVVAVARHGDGALADGFARALVQVDGGGRLADALEPMRLLGAPAAPLIDALLAADRYGTPLGPALDRLADDARQVRRRRVEEEARKVPVRLLFPLVACILPSVGLLTVIPVAVAAVGGLSW